MQKLGIRHFLDLWLQSWPFCSWHTLFASTRPSFQAVNTCWKTTPKENENSRTYNYTFIDGNEITVLLVLHTGVQVVITRLFSTNCCEFTLLKIILYGILKIGGFESPSPCFSLPTWLTVVCETKWDETKWKSVVCEMEICSLRNGNL